MFIYEPSSNSHLEIPIPKMTMVAQAQCYIPLVEYFNPLTGNRNLYFYVNTEPTLERFERDIERSLGKAYLEPKGQGRITIRNWDNFNVQNKLAYLSEGTKTDEVCGLYNSQTNTLTVGVYNDFEATIGNNDIIIQTVYARSYSKVEYDKTARVLYQTETGIEFRYALNIELLTNNPTLYVLGTSLLLINGVKLEFITPVFSSTSINKLKSAIYKMYMLDDSCVHGMNIFPITVAHVSEEVEEISNANRIDKYNIIMDMSTNYAYIRSLKDINPMFSQAKGLPNPTQNSRLMPVYSF